MATAKYGALVTDIKGSIGSVTFRRMSGGALLTNRTTKTGSFSKAQMDVQKRLWILHRYWTNTNDTVRGWWQNHATIVANTIGIGSGKKSSGFRCYMKFQMECWKTETDVNFAIPTTYRREAPQSIYGQFRFGHPALIFVNDRGVNGYCWCVIQASRSFRVYPVQPTSWKTIYHGSQPVSGSINVTTALYSAWGEPALAEYISLRVRVFQYKPPVQSWSSPWTYGSVFVTP